MNTMNQKMALCNQLNMNFEEANELFDNESLESMQMARVNGGEPISALLLAIAAVITACTGVAALGYTIYHTEKELPKDGSTPSTTSESELKTLFENVGPGGSVKIDSLIDGKWYNVDIIFGTPTPDR